MQPQWGGATQQLHFISDRREGWWNVWREDEGGLSCVCEMAAEVGGPAWLFGGRAYHVFSNGQVGSWAGLSVCLWYSIALEWTLSAVPMKFWTAQRPEHLTTQN
jgi:hypothetical protein